MVASKRLERRLADSAVADSHVILLDQIPGVSQFPVVELHVPLDGRNVGVPQQSPDLGAIHHVESARPGKTP